jgi:hypothetical protein
MRLPIEAGRGGLVAARRDGQPPRPADGANSVTGGAPVRV